MERDSHHYYESFLVNNGAGDECSSDEVSTFNSMFSGVSLLSLLGANQEALLTSMPLFGDFPIPPLTYSAPQTTFPPTFAFHDGASAAASSSRGLLFAKPEPLVFEDSAPSAAIMPYNFMFTGSEARADSHVLTHHHLHLPNLLSLERANDDSSFGLLSQKRARVDSATHYRHHPVLNSLEVTRRGSRLPLTPKCDTSPPPMIPRGSALARKRRQKLSEKTRCLERLLPWDKKMDMATMLEEAYKYVRFLQAQVTALKDMPTESGVDAALLQRINGCDNLRGDPRDEGEFAELEKLTRSQLLQVLVNSPAAQTILYSQGYCVFSVEQVDLLEKVTTAMRRRRGSNNIPLPPTLFSSF